MIHVECPDCSKSYEVADALAGRTAKCRECGGRIPIPQLCTDTDTAASRTKPAHRKPAPDKSPSPKAAIPPPAKPSVKPKAAPKADDFFEDDFEDVEDYDEVDDDYESLPRVAKRRSKPKPKPKATKRAKPERRSRPHVDMPGVIVFLLVLTLLSAALGVWNLMAALEVRNAIAVVVEVIRLVFAFISFLLLVVRWRISWFILRIFYLLPIVLLLLAVGLMVFAVITNGAQNLPGRVIAGTAVNAVVLLALIAIYAKLGEEHVRAYYGFDD